MSVGYTDIRVNNLFQKYAGTRVIILFNQTSYEIHKSKWLVSRNNFALSSVTQTTVWRQYKYVEW